MNRAAKRPLVLIILLIAAAGLLAWRLWPGGAQARRHQRDMALVSAVQRNDLSAATRLLDAGADPNGVMPPISATQKIQAYYFCVSHRINLPSWSDLDKMNPHFSLLEWATVRGDADMVSALLARGADAGYRDQRNNSALTWAERMKGAPRNGRDYPRVLALLKAADAQAHHTGNKP